MFCSTSSSMEVIYPQWVCASLNQVYVSAGNWIPFQHSWSRRTKDCIHNHTSISHIYTYPFQGLHALYLSSQGVSSDRDLSMSTALGVANTLERQGKIPEPTVELSVELLWHLPRQPGSSLVPAAMQIWIALQTFFRGSIFFDSPLSLFSFSPSLCEVSDTIDFYLQLIPNPDASNILLISSNFFS